MWKKIIIKVVDVWYMFDLVPDKAELDPKKRPREEIQAYLRNYAKEQANILITDSFFHRYDVGLGEAVRNPYRHPIVLLTAVLPGC